MLKKILISFGALLLWPAVTFAAKPALIGGTLQPGAQGQAGAALTGDSAAVEGYLTQVFITHIANILIGWTAALAVLFLVLAGYRYVTADGDSDKISTAHRTIGWALGGVLVALLSYALVEIVTNIHFADSGGGGGGGFGINLGGFHFGF